MNYRLEQSYFVTYPLTASLINTTHFACYYTIDYAFTGRNYLTVDVLENWTWETRPIAISAAMQLPLDKTKTQEQNAKPDDRWQLVFEKQNAITIGAWKAKTPKEQAEYLGEIYKDPDAPEVPEEEKDPEKADDDKEATGLAAGLKNLFSSSNPGGKANLLWIILAGILTLIAGISLWVYRRYRRAKKKAEYAALKYGKHTQDVVDVLT